MNLKTTTIKKIAGLYSKFFKVKSSKNVEKFIETLLFVFIATGISKGLWFVINIVGGRVLGPSLYGEFTLVQAITEIIVIPVGIGVTTGIMKYLAETDKKERITKLISTATTYFFITLIPLVAIYTILNNQIADIFNTGNHLVLLAIFLSIFWALNGFLEQVLQGLHAQKKWSKFSTIAYITSAIVFVYILFTSSTTILLLYVPYLVTFVVFSAQGITYIWKFIKPKEFSSKYLKELTSYGIIAFLVYIATTFLGNVDRIMINYILGATQLGFYQAYYLSSIMILGVLFGIFIRVFFPTAAKHKDPEGMTKKLDKIAPIGFFGAIIISMITIYISLYLYNYEYNIISGIIFSVVTAISFLVVIYSNLLNAQSTKSIKKTLWGMIGAFLINIPLNYFLIKSIGINGAIISTGISFLLLVVYIRINLSKISSSKQSQ